MCSPWKLCQPGQTLSGQISERLPSELGDAGLDISRSGEVLCSRLGDGRTFLEAELVVQRLPGLVLSLGND